MKLHLKNIAAGCLLMTAVLPAWGQTAPELAVRMDDMGAFHSVNEAVLKAYDFGIARTVEVMPVAPWFPEAVKMLKQMPGLDVGIHLTFTSEWENMKWRPLTQCPSLVDENGYFYPMIKPNPNYPGQSVTEHPYDLAEVEKEFRAQIEAVLKHVPWASHLSGHMGSTILNKELNDLANRLAREYNLVSIDKTTSQEKGFQFISFMGPKQTPEEKEQSFINMLNKLQAGQRYMFIEHPALDNEEMENVFHIGYENVAADRQGVTDLYTSERIRQAIRNRGIRLITVGQLANQLPRNLSASMTRHIDQYMAAAAEKGLDIHSMMVLQHGKVIGEKWQSLGHPDVPHVLNSVSKTFTSTAVGLAVGEGKLKLTDKVISFFPDKLPAKVSDHLAAMTVRDLLTMTCGHERANTTIQRQTEEEWVKGFLALPVPHKPGTFYAYNGLGTYMLSAIVQKATGQKMLDYLQPRLFRPLGITGVTWEESPQGINTGGWGLRLKTEDLAKMGQLYLQKGVWNGQQVLPKGWVEEASARQVASRPAGMSDEQFKRTDPASNDWMQGYGYQIWRCRHNAYRADGARGQFIIVIPDKDAVVAVTGDLAKMGDELNLIWDIIYPQL